MLSIYEDNGFHVFRCKQDKSPNTPGFFPEDKARKKYDKATGEEKKNYDWMQPENQIDFEKAKDLQNLGEMIGAHIPEDIIILDLDRHDPDKDGVEYFKFLKTKLSLNIDFLDSTAVVRTAGNGFHVFFYVGKNHGFKQGELSVEGNGVGIDIKTNMGYVIAAGSPGYEVLCEADPMELSEELAEWIRGVQKAGKKTAPVKTEKYAPNEKIPAALLEKILKKLDVRQFDNEQKWYDLIVSAIAAAGDTEEVFDLLTEWSAGDTRYGDCSDRIRSFAADKENGITIGTFIHILKENGVTDYYVKKIKEQAVSVEIYSSINDDGRALPFPEPDYKMISDSKEASELFLTCGNSVAATILGYAIAGHVIWSETDGDFFVFDGNRWSELYDIFSTIYIVLIRLAKFMYATRNNSDTDHEHFLKMIKTVNKTNWKRETANELKTRDGIFVKSPPWDSERLKETLTTLDGVLDFTTDKLIYRKGEKEEYRLKAIPFTNDDIERAESPSAYLRFLADLFPDHDTYITARQALSMFISGNAKKNFQVYHGSGDNGKSTLLEIEKLILGEKAMLYDTEVIVNNKYVKDSLPPDVADFRGAYLLYGQEVTKGRQLSLGKIKRMTGDDTINARALYKMPISFRPTWQMVFSCNDLPFFDGSDIAFIGRLLVLPFMHAFVKGQKREDLIKSGFPENMIKEPKDGDKIKSDIMKEKPAIIKQKIYDYIELRERFGLEIQQSEECKNHKKNYIADNNDFDSFISEMCMVGGNSDYFVTSKDICDAYKEYSGDFKVSDRFVVRSLLACRREVSRVTKVVTVMEHSYTTGEDFEKKVQKRGLAGIRLKSIFEMENDGGDVIPF